MPTAWVSDNNGIEMPDGMTILGVNDVHSRLLPNRAKQVEQGVWLWLIFHWCDYYKLASGWVTSWMFGRVRQFIWEMLAWARLAALESEGYSINMAVPALETLGYFRV